MQTATGAGLSNSTTTLKRVPSDEDPVRRWGTKRGGGGNIVFGLERAAGTTTFSIGADEVVVCDISRTFLGHRDQTRITGDKVVANKANLVSERT